MRALGCAARKNRMKPKSCFKGTVSVLLGKARVLWVGIWGFCSFWFGGFLLFLSFLWGLSFPAVSWWPYQVWVASLQWHKLIRFLTSCWGSELASMLLSPPSRSRGCHLLRRRSLTTILAWGSGVGVQTWARLTSKAAGAVTLLKLVWLQNTPKRIMCPGLGF